MAIIKDGKIMNTKEDNKYINEWLANLPRVKVIDKSSGAVIGTMPMATMMSDYKWQLNALNHRLEHPENYQDEDIEATIARLRKWLEEHTPEPPETEKECDAIYVRGFTSLQDAI